MLTPFNADKSIDWHSFDRLTDWYIKAGASGLFAVCQSSEMHLLSDDERIELATRLVKRVGDQLPIIATGTFSYDIDQQAAMITKMHATGVDAVVCLTNYLAAESESDEQLLDNCQQLLKKTADIPLGLYECPLPYKRLLSVELTQVMAQSNRFYWYKETSEDAATVLAKTRLTSDTTLRIYNAHTASLLETLRGGSAGFSGIAANYYPALFSWLCGNFDQHPAEADELSQFLVKMQSTVDHKYPYAAKQLLVEQGILTTSVARLGDVVLESADLEATSKLHIEAQRWLERLEITQS